MCPTFISLAALDVSLAMVRSVDVSIAQGILVSMGANLAPIYLVILSFLAVDASRANIILSFKSAMSVANLAPAC